MKRLATKLKRSPQSGTSRDARRATGMASLDATLSNEIADQQPTLESANRKSKKNAALDTLPPEVRRHLLSVLDLPELETLVRASPTFHQQYLFDRKYLLYRSITNSLGPVLVDAHAVQVSEGSNKRLFLQHSAETACLPLINNLTEETVVRMAAFHTNYVTPILKFFARWTIDNLSKHLEGKQWKDGLSSTETTRLARAIYRFQLLSQLAEPTKKTGRLSRAEAIQGFFGMLEPWEVEELFSFYQFARHVYNNIFKDIRDDIHPDNPRFNDQVRPPTPEGAFDLDSEDRDNYLEGTTLLGLNLLHTVLFQVKGHKHLVDLMRQNLTQLYIPLNTLEGILGETQQALRLENHPSDRDRMQEDRALLPFPGDDEPDAPPLAWTMIWGGTYSNLYGWYISDEMRSCGFVFWDAATLDRAGAKEALKRQWEEYWDGEDPRDSIV